MINEINKFLKLLIQKYEKTTFKGKNEVIKDLKLLEELINLEVKNEKDYN